MKTSLRKQKNIILDMNESTAELDAKYKIEISSTATRTDPVVGIS
jgi:hypothetical protein